MTGNKNVETSPNMQTSMFADEDTELETPYESTDDDDGGGTALSSPTKDDDDIIVIEEDENASSAQGAATVEGGGDDDDDDGEGASQDSVDGGESGKRKGRLNARIDELTFKVREAERQREELLRLSKGLIEQNQTLTGQLQQSNTTTYEATKAQLDSQLASAKTELQTAYEAADAAKIADAQVKLSEITSRRALLLSRPPKAPVKPTTARPETSTKTSSTAAERPVISPRTTQWLQTNRWFQAPGHEELTNFAFSIHDNLVATGVEEGSEAYFKTIDKRLREVFPSQFKKLDVKMSDGKTPQGQPGNARTASSRPPVANGAQNGSGAGSSRTVRLTPTQVSIAKSLGLTTKEYAAQLLKERKQNA